MSRLLHASTNWKGWFAGLKASSDTPNNVNDGAQVGKAGAEEVVETEDVVLHFVVEGWVEELVTEVEDVVLDFVVEVLMEELVTVTEDLELDFVVEV